MPSHWLSNACFTLPHLIGIWPCYIELSLLTAGGEEGGDPARQDHVRRPEGAGRGQEWEGDGGPARQHCLVH